MDAQCKAIIFDVDGTLYRQAPVRRAIAWRLARYAAQRPLAGWKTAWGLRCFRRAQEDLRHASGDDKLACRQIEYAARSSGLSEDFLREIVSCWMETLPLDAVRRARYSDAEEFCAWAAQRGLQLAALSDYDPRRKLRSLGLDKYISLTICAADADIGAFKPSPLGLQAAVLRLGVEPQEAIYIGDRPEVDGAAALAAGVPAIILSSPRKQPQGLRYARNWQAIKAMVETRLNNAAAASREITATKVS